MLHQHSIAELRQLLDRKEVSSRELTEHYLDRINYLDASINAYITQTPEHALAQAQKADDRLNAGESSPLLGIPYAHKDIFCVEGIRTTCGSKMLENFESPYNATVSTKLDDAGAVMLGKANMDEFAMGSSNETSYFGPVSNPWRINCVPGGSSGGSAAAVAAEIAPIATATDTGGSIRQPAALCNLTGIKPTYGRCSRYGMIAFASSLDQAGVLARTAMDAAMMLETISGYDAKDSTSIDKAPVAYSQLLDEPLAGLTAGIPKEYFQDGLRAETEQQIQNAIEILEQLGVKTKEISLPHTKFSVPAYYVIAPAECSANLSRFDGIRYGHRCDDPQDINDLICRSRSEGFGDEVKRRILIGTYALSAGYYDAYYNQAMKVRRLIKNDFDAAFEQGCDFILGPTTPSPAFEFGAKTNDPVAMYLEDIYTIATNLAGLPGLSTPCGLVDGLPVGLQLIGKPFDEAGILRVAHQFQQASAYHTERATQLAELEASAGLTSGGAA